MRLRILWLSLILVFTLAATACAEKAPAPTGGDADNRQYFEKPVLNHPDDLYIEFDESVSERDRQLVTLGVEITRPLFEDYEIPLTAEIYVSDSEESYLKFASDIWVSLSTEEHLEYYRTLVGVTRPIDARIVISLSKLDTRHTRASRDNEIVSAVVHELYHVLQTKISNGWFIVSGTPKYLVESSARLASRRAILAYFCEPWTNADPPVSLSSGKSDCTSEFVEKYILDYTVFNMFRKTGIPTVEIYILSEFGLDAFDRFYIALSDTTTETPGDQIWTDALEKTFNVSSLEDLQAKAIEYIKEHSDELIQRYESINY